MRVAPSAEPIALVCPACGAPVAGGPGESAYRCGACARVYPVRAGVAHFLVAAPDAGVTRTAERFGYEWTRFSEILPQYEQQFLAWIAPLTRDDFRDRVVVDAGCGKGRHARLAAAFGARAVLGIEIGSAIDAAAANTRGLPAVRLFQADLRRSPVAPGSADLVYSIGVLHHLETPAEGVRALARLVKPGGRLLVWVYAAEGNGWVVTLVNPLRAITSRLPLPLVRAGALALAAPLWLALQALYRPARTRPRLARWLPYRAYLDSLVEFPLREVHAITFDHLLAPVAHYVRRDEVAGWITASGLRLESLRWHNRNGWTAVGVRAAGEP